MNQSNDAPHCEEQKYVLQLSWKEDAKWSKNRFQFPFAIKQPKEAGNEIK